MEKQENIEFSWINNPEDILGIGLKNLLNYRYGDPKFHTAVEKLNQTVMFDFEELYAVSVRFQKPTIEIQPFEGKTHNLELKMSINTLIVIMKGDSSMVGAFLKRKIKITRWWKLLTIIRLLKILLPTLNIAKERAESYGRPECS